MKTSMTVAFFEKQWENISWFYTAAFPCVHKSNRSHARYRRALLLLL
jgi:hypothetical protein